MFGNDPAEVASIVHDALRGPFARRFAAVIFAIVDWSAKARFIDPFRQRFASMGPVDDT